MTASVTHPHDAPESLGALALALELAGPTPPLVPLTIKIAQPLAKNLAANSRLHWTKQHALKDAQAAEANAEALAATDPAGRPYFAPGTPILVVLRISRPTAGHVIDAAAIIEATKAALDGVQGVIYGDDTDVTAFVIGRDLPPPPPARRGQPRPVRWLYLTFVAAPHGLAALVAERGAL